MPTLYPSPSFVALQQHANPSASETVAATPVERGRNVTISQFILVNFQIIRVNAKEISLLKQIGRPMVEDKQIERERYEVQKK